MILLWLLLLLPLRFGDVGYRFPESIIWGVAHMDTGKVDLNPPADYRVRCSHNG